MGRFCQKHNICGVIGAQHCLEAPHRSIDLGDDPTSVLWAVVLTYLPAARRTLDTIRKARQSPRLGLQRRTGK